MVWLRTIIRWLRKPASGNFFFFIIILNLLSNYIYIIFNSTFYIIICIFFISSIIAYLENVIYLFINIKWLRYLYVFLIVTFQNVLIIFDVFLLFNFQKILNQYVVDILADTNSIEIDNFIQTYISTNFCLGIGLVVILLNILIYYLSTILVKSRANHFFLMSSLCGFFITCFCGYSFIKYRNGMSIPQCSTITRGGYALYLMKVKKRQIGELRNVCKDLEAYQVSSKKPIVVVVIGESYSIYHSSLYGYEKLTNPLLEKHYNNGNLFLFDNVVTVFDGTNESMRAIFSLDSLGVDFSKHSLFPACFKAVGYNTFLFDNQYFVGSGVSLLTDKQLSDEMFDYRNKKRFLYDGMMVDSIKVLKPVSLYVFHLWGQHFNYSNRYPKEYSKFKASEYSKENTNVQRKIMADYDNATLYNDYVVDKILKKFQDQYCCVFYFSDHGEEIYELRDYMGHGNASYSPNLNYQIRVPLMVYFSPSFYNENESLVKKMKKAEHYPICTDDIGHTIIDIAGIKVNDFVPSRSFINDQFDINRHRIVLNSIDYDVKWMRNK